VLIILPPGNITAIFFLFQGIKWQAEKGKMVKKISAITLSTTHSRGKLHDGSFAEFLHIIPILLYHYYVVIIIILYLH
jgi:hypothetical protein